jgi:lysophospholipase L1-like esterase
MTSYRIRVARTVTAAGGALVLLAGVLCTGSPAAVDAAGDPPAGVVAPLRIMPLGDSITFGSGSPTKSSYRVDLYRRLGQAGVAVDFVGSVRSGAAGSGADLDHEGHPGLRIGQVAERLDGWLATYQPDVVLLHLGTNDTHTDARAVGAPARLSALIDQITAARPDAHVFVSRIVGAQDAPDHGAQQRRITAFNAAVPGIVAGRGPRVHLVDHSLIDEADLADKLHPNDHGYAKMSALWYRALLRVRHDTRP